MIEIVQRENPVLRGTARPVPLADISKSEIKDIVKRMKKALEEQADGVAIAAPQIGEPWRIFVVSKRLFELKDPQSPTLADAETMAATGELSTVKKEKKYEDAVYINPEIIKISKKRRYMPEGCLSVRWLYGKVLRAEKAKVRAYNEKGEVFEIGGSGLLAQVFQHEIDHLNGILFSDIGTDLHEMPPEKREKEKVKK